MRLGLLSVLVALVVVGGFSGAATTLVEPAAVAVSQAMPAPPRPALPSPDAVVFEKSVYDMSHEEVMESFAMVVAGLEAVAANPPDMGAGLVAEPFARQCARNLDESLGRKLIYVQTNLEICQDFLLSLLE